MKDFIRKTDGSKEKNTWKKQYFLVYTALFSLIALFVFSWFFLTGKTFIYDVDGWDQHYRALVYYGRYLRSIFRGIFLEHQFIIPEWDFSIGEGSDILGTLNYYVIGDPFAFFSFLIPMRFMYIFYEAMILLRMYLSGIAFSCLCFHTGKKNRYAVMAGAMSYVFCFWAIYNAAKHPYFLNPMLYFPLLILGIEKILKKQRPYFFVIAVFLSAVSNFYFFYILVLVTILYVAARVLSIYRKDIKNMVRAVLRIGAYSVLGLLLAAVIFVPVCYVFLNDTRMSTDTSVRLFYSLSYYAKLPTLFATADESHWSCAGMAAPTLIAVLFLFYKRKQYALLKGMFLACIVIFMLPFLGYALNGFSYAANRWSWAFALLSSYILTVAWPSLMEMKKKSGIFLFGGTIIYFLYCLIVGCFSSDTILTKNAGAAAIIALLFLLLVFPTKNGDGFLPGKRKQQLGLLLIALGVLNNSYWLFSPNGTNYASRTKDTAHLTEALIYNETAALNQIAAADGIGEFYRYSGSDLTRNANMISGLSSTQYYWTLSNPHMITFKKYMELTEPHAHRYEGYSERAELLTLASVRYYAAPPGRSVPYGFSYIDTFDDRYAIYRNDYALPLGYTYDSYLSEDTWNSFSVTEKQEALLQSLILEENGSASKEDGFAFQEGTPIFENKEIPYTTACKGDVELQDHAFVVTSENASVKLKFTGFPDCETYFSIGDLSFQAPSAKHNLFAEIPTNVKLKLSSSSSVKKSVTYPTEEYDRYNDRHEFAVNFGYSEDAVTSITIKFSQAGTYYFDSFQVMCQPMSSYAKHIAARKADTLEHMEITPDTVTGSISLDAPKLLCLSIPYAKGWHIYVDGKEEELLRANIQYMAVALEAGNHDIRLSYASPMRKEGAFLSAAALLVFTVLIFIRERNKASAA